MANSGTGIQNWRKSSRCESHSCVEVALGSASAAVRNTALPEDHLTFTAPAWRNFVNAIRSGQFAAGE